MTTTISDEQAGVFAWLSDPASHPDRPAVERIDTHSASVFLAGPRAYKVKRAIRYSFLDYSTLELRRRACELELRLNRRTAPRLYLDVVPVTRAGSGQLALAGEGAPIEWLVVMERFPQEQLLDRLATTGGVSGRLASQLADRVAEFHAVAAPTPHHGGAAAMRAVVDDNARAFEAASALIDATAARAVTTSCGRAIDRWRKALDRRRANGAVRQCHGDLHLRNIVLLDGQPTLFDAIEFNDDFACIDVWYDVAFLLMDLLARGLADQANIVMNQYLFRTGDLAGLVLLPVFLGCRAAVRAKTSLASAAIETDGARRDDYVARAREYLSLATRVLTPADPRLIAIGGLSGSGKSTLAAALAPGAGAPPGAVVLRSDVVRKALFHLAPDQRLGADGYTAEATREVYRALLMRAKDVLAAGGSAVVDATFLAPGRRREVADLAEAAAVPFTGVWLDAPTATLTDRLRQRRHDASDATVEVLQGQQAADAGEITWVRLDATRASGDLAAQVQIEMRRAGRSAPDSLAAFRQPGDEPLGSRRRTPESR
jgi:aminoglycoside phosphotransferase family enzyme/predicted kinase